MAWKSCEVEQNTAGILKSRSYLIKLLLTDDTLYALESDSNVLMWVVVLRQTKARSAYDSKL